MPAYLIETVGETVCIHIPFVLLRAYPGMQSNMSQRQGVHNRKQGKDLIRGIPAQPEFNRKAHLQLPDRLQQSLRLFYKRKNPRHPVQKRLHRGKDTPY